MNDDGFESFAVDDEDLERALNPGTRRQFQSKNEAIYGIWAGREGGSDEDDDVITTRGRGKRDGKRRTNYSAPVSFVSGGIKVGNTMETSKNEPEKETNARPPPVKQVRQAGANVFAGMRASANRAAVDPNKPADWAKFGKGNVIMNMMKNMGYKEGSGLGVSGQGIIEPVQAAVRAGRGAVGAYGKEATGPKFGESAADAQKRLAEDAESGYVNDNQISKSKPGWKKTAAVKLKYRTLDEVMEEGANSETKPSREHLKEKVIDMTGKEQRVYSGYDSFTNRTRQVDEELVRREHFDIPELEHNINLQTQTTEQVVRKRGLQNRTMKDSNIALEYEMQRLNEKEVELRRELQRRKELVDLIRRFSLRDDEISHAMNEYQSLFMTLKEKFRLEYKLLSLESIAIPCVLPQIKKYFSVWRPLDPEHLIFGIDLMKEWKDILVENEDKGILASNIQSFDQISAFDRLLWEGWMPYIRTAAQRWEPRVQVEVMLKIIEVWLPLLPNWMKDNLLEQIIIPRIDKAVNEWDPTQDDIPVHSWIIPWLGVLGDRLKQTICSVRQKLGEILQKRWTPLDQSAISILMPWVDVWAPNTLAAFMARYVVPKLDDCLKTMNLDPRENIHYPEWEAVLAWMKIINTDTIASIINRSFIPRFHELLYSWLDSGNADMEEVKQWYREWWSRIPKPLMDFPSIKENMRRMLMLIAQTQKGLKLSRSLEVEMVTNATAAPTAPIVQRTPQQSLSFKEMIEMLASRHDLTHIPQNDRFKDGRQVYWFGPLSIYMDKSMVYVLDITSFTWKAVSLDELLHLAGVTV
ncbi:unnamed protein product [Auanema sp. JU1783]|nr:unnamed protein product [Auanema sp. JU1783]